MGQKVAKLKPVDGFSAESSAALTLAISSGFGIPVSTTHTITGAIMGVGSLRRLSAVRWGVAYNIVWAWILTIPAAALISALAYLLAGRFLASVP
jgi:PiT family inorganic phosphate transporter